MKHKLLLCGLTHVALLTVNASVDTYIWDGTVSSAMSNSANWGGSPGGVVPPANSLITFPASPTSFTVNNDISAYNIGPLTFNGAYTVTGDPFIVAAGQGPALTFTTDGTSIDCSGGMVLNGTLSIFNSSTGSNSLGSIGSGTGLLSVQEGTFEISNPSSYLGTIDLLVSSTQTSPGQDTVLQAGAIGAFGAPVLVNLTSGVVGSTAHSSTLNLNGYRQTIGGLSGGVNTFVDMGSGNLTVTTASSQTPFYGEISGSGQLIVESNSLALTGFNTYTGNTTINNGGTLSTLDLGDTAALIFGSGGGTLQLGSSFSSSIPITIEDATTITTDGYEVTLSGSIGAGNSAFTKIGRGTLTLSGTNGNEGPIIISGGVLNMNSNSLPSTVGSITFKNYGGALQAAESMTISQPVSLAIAATIDVQSYDVTMNGPISGGSKLTKEGSGTLTLGSPGNNYTGKTQINDGTLNATSMTIPANAGGTPQLVFSGSGNGIFQAGSDFPNFVPSIVLESDATIDVQTYNVTVSGTVAGKSTHTLTKIGTGALTFTGPSTFSGSLHIVEGGFSANEDFAGDLQIHSGSVLKGNGHIAGTVTIADNATLSPGNSIGTITVGNLILEPNSTTFIEIGAGESSKIIVDHTAIVDGFLQISPDAGAYTRQGSYEIISADTLSGVFTSHNTSPGFTFELSYFSDAVYLDYTLAIPTSGLKGDNLKVAKYLNAHAIPSNEFTSLAALSGNTLNKALSSISPARNGFSTYIAQQTAFSLSSVLMGHMDSLRIERSMPSEGSFMAALSADASDRIQMPVKNKKLKNKFSLWASGFGEYAHQKTESQNPSFKYASGGALGGFDYYGEDRDVVGSALGYAHTHFSEDHNMGYGNINYYFASMYGNVFAGNFYFSPAVWGIFNETKNTRLISFPGFSEEAKADMFAWQLLPHLEVGYDVQMSWGSITPFSAADWAITWQRGYHEHGASPFNASSKSKSNSMVRSETGLKLCEKWEYTWGACFLKEKLSYIFQKPYGSGTVGTSFTGSPSTFTVTAVNQNLNLGDVGVDFTLAIGKDKPASINVGYEGEFGSKYWSNQLVFTFKKEF